MKKVSLQTILDTLTSIDFDNEILNEIRAELTKGDAKKAENAQAYEAVKPIVMDALEQGDATIAELYEAIKDQLPEGMTKQKIQYAVTRLWKEEVIKTEGSPNTYRKA